MPNEKRKRGRRELQKRKKQAHSTLEISKKPRLDKDEGEYNVEIRLDEAKALAEPLSHSSAYACSVDNHAVISPEPDESNFEVQSHDNAADHHGSRETQFYGLLDAEEQAYFKGADRILELNDFTSAEDRQLFLDSVWREADGKELKLASSQSCSRVLERLIRGSSTTQLKQLFGQFQGHFLDLTQHRFASHCCEALFLQLAPQVTEELVQPGSQDGQNEAGGDKSSAEELFLSAIREMQNDIGFLLVNAFASHTLRVLFVVLSGLPLSSSSTVAILQSKRKEHIPDTASVFESHAVKDVRPVPRSFTAALEQAIENMLGSLDSNALRSLAIQPLANPLLQLLLEIEFRREAHKGAKPQYTLFHRLVPDILQSGDTSSATFLRSLLFDPVGSHLLETIVQHAPGKIFKAIYKDVIRDNMLGIARNEVASFVLIKILHRIGADDLRFALKQLIPHLPQLVEAGRLSLIRTLIERSAVRNIDSQALAEGLESTYGGEGPDLLFRMLMLDDADVTSESTNTLAGHRLEKGHAARKMQASLMAQAMLDHPGALRALICQTLLALDNDQLIRIAKDRNATHVLQKAMTPPAAPIAFRRQLLPKFRGRLTDLACDTIGSHVLDSLWNATVDLQFLRDSQATELLSQEQEIRDSFSGRAVWRNWMLDSYRISKSSWIAKGKRRDADQQFAAPPADNRKEQQKR